MAIKTPHWSEIVPREAWAACDPVADGLRTAFLRRRHGGGLPSCDVTALLAHLDAQLPGGLSLTLPGAATGGFDEDWLLAILAAMDRADTASYRFLLRSRLSETAASQAHFLLARARLALIAGP